MMMDCLTGRLQYSASSSRFDWNDHQDETARPDISFFGGNNPFLNVLYQAFRVFLYYSSTHKINANMSVRVCVRSKKCIYKKINLLLCVGALDDLYLDLHKGTYI